MKHFAYFVGLLLLPAISLAQTPISKLNLQESVKWIEETPTNPEEYIGRVLLADKLGNLTPHFQSIPIPFESKDEPSIKKSVLVKVGAGGSAGFAEIVKIKASAESVYQFQEVNTRVWSAKSKDPKYVEAIARFRNDPSTAPLFTSKDLQAVLMCVGVVQKKVWYKVFRKKDLFASATYVVNVDGNAYSASEEYEEVVKFGLLIRPLSGYGITLPAAIANATELENLIGDVGAVQRATQALNLVERIRW